MTKTPSHAEVYSYVKKEFIPLKEKVCDYAREIVFRAVVDAHEKFGEYALWDRYERLRRIAKDAGGWWVRRDSQEMPEFVAMDEWLKLYDEWPDKGLMRDVK